MSRERRSEMRPPVPTAEEPSCEPATPLLEAIVAEAPLPNLRPARQPLGAPLVGECIDDRHPTLPGRVRVRFERPGRGTEERWVPVLVGVVVRAEDRVLLLEPANWNEPVVTGVLDGFEERRERPRSAAHALELALDETIEVVSRDGQPLLSVWEGPSGPVVRLLDADAEVELAGKLALRADAVEIEARKGGVELKAASNVDLKGDTINLN